jgi:hypothetical protein
MIRHVQGAREQTRYVERFTRMGAPLAFRELCERVVPPETRFIVFDLDRTLHLGRNMGELLGWEICAHLSYGRHYLDVLEAGRVGGRVYLERRRPMGALRYMRLAADHWVPPGLFYLLWGKIASRVRALRRRSYLRFGPEPVRAVQSIPQHALLHRIATLPLATVRELAARVWQRYRGDQTVERADIEWLRRRCPGVKIIISSASPQPTLEAGAAELGVDDIVYSTLEEHEGRLSAPCDLRRLARPEAAPHRITPPSKSRINAGHAKLDELYARYPELRDPGVISVGISDTGYGEDHCWAEAFTHVVDVNSTSPFPPIVPAEARVRWIVSAAILTRREQDARAGGDAGFLDARRRGAAGPAGAALDLGSEELAARLGPVHAEVERLCRSLDDAARRVEPELARLGDEVSRVEAAIERDVAGFNDAEGGGRSAARRALADHLRERARVVVRQKRVERPVSALAFALDVALERSRALI